MYLIRIMTNLIVKNAFNTWVQFTKESKENYLKEELIENVEFIENVVHDSKTHVLETLDDIYKINTEIDDYSVSNVLIEETINKFKEAYDNLKIIINDIKKI